MAQRILLLGPRIRFHGVSRLWLPQAGRCRGLWKMRLVRASFTNMGAAAGPRAVNRTSMRNGFCTIGARAGSPSILDPTGRSYAWGAASYRSSNSPLPDQRRATCPMMGFVSLQRRSRSVICALAVIASPAMWTAGGGRGGGYCARLIALDSRLVSQGGAASAFRPRRAGLLPNPELLDVFWDWRARRPNMVRGRLGQQCGVESQGGKRAIAGLARLAWAGAQPIRRSTFYGRGPAYGGRAPGKAKKRPAFPYQSRKWCRAEDKAAEG